MVADAIKDYMGYDFPVRVEYYCSSVPHFSHHAQVSRDWAGWDHCSEIDDAISDYREEHGR